MLYVDTSALVQAYVHEAGTERILHRLRDAEAVASPVLLRHPLRSADAVHLASAAFLAESGIPVAFACADRALLAAAIAERLPAFDPAE